MNNKPEFNSLVGIPWVVGRSDKKGADCWGLIAIFYDKHFDIQLGGFMVKNIDTPEKVTDNINHLKNNPEKWAKTDNKRIGDVAVMFSKKNGRPEHVGIYVGENMILHSMHKSQSEIHKIKLILKLFKKIEFYKHVA